MHQINDKLYNWASVLDEGTRLQAERISRLPILAGPVALMPDAHVGIGATVGSVIATDGAIIPSAVGVDIGCGMEAVKTSLAAEDLPEDLNPFLDVIKDRLPAGVGREVKYIRGSFRTWEKKHPMNPDWDSKIKIKAARQFGTLGSGNHFFEICLDQNDAVWIVLHSGSRGPGNMLAQGHIHTARKDFKNWAEGNYNLEDQDLAWFLEGTPEFDSYITDLLWAQEYAFGNRAEMMRHATGAFFHWVGTGQTVMQISCHHNFCQKEDFDGKQVWVTRKGAIQARDGQWGIIPGSMGTKSYIVTGRGNTVSWNSCSHGAGRVMSRGEAKRNYTAKDLRKAMTDRVWLDADADRLVDEIPAAYKDIDQVMEDQKDLVEVQYTLRQILNYKGI